MIKCDNLDHMSLVIEEGGLHNTQGILHWRHCLGDCYCECGEVKKECREQMIYFADKTGSILNLKKEPCTTTKK